MDENLHIHRDLPETESFFEEQKIRLFAAVYAQEWPKATAILETIYQKAFLISESKNRPLLENDEKRLNQILVFLNALRDTSQKEHFAGQKKFFTRHQDLKKLLVSQVRKSGTRQKSVSFNTWKSRLGLSKAQYALLLKTVMTFQLSKGCSNFCRRCNEWALPKVRSHFCFDAIQNILAGMAAQKNNEISLYGASDPLDWQENSKNIEDVIQTARQFHLEYSLLTKMPKGKAPLLSRLIQSGANLSVSMTARNKIRIRQLEDRIGKILAKQHDIEDLLIPACLDEDFKTIKPSITDSYGTEITPDGAFIIIPTFTSSLHPFGHKKITITADTHFFPVKKTGRNALLVDYFKPLQVYDLSGRITHLDRLLDVQIESILLDTGAEDLTPPGMRSLMEYFSIFDKKARLQRKKMTLTVIRKLKTRYLEQFRYKNLPQKTREEYKTRIKSHLALCKKENCLKARKDTAAFLIRAIIAYLKDNPVKAVIIRHLLKDEIKNNVALPALTSKNITELFLKQDVNAFHLFRQIVVALLTNSEPRVAIEHFSAVGRVVYDPVSDIFTTP